MINNSKVMCYAENRISRFQWTERFPNLLFNPAAFQHFCTAFCSVPFPDAVKSLYELEPETFSKSSVVLNKDTVDIRDFYDNLSYDLKQKGWFYTNPQGKRISLDSISDYRIKDHQVYKNVAGQKYRVTVDTVRVRYPEPAEGKRFPTYHISGADSQNMPSMGRQSWGKVRVREFVVDSTLAPDRQKRLQKICGQLQRLSQLHRRTREAAPPERDCRHYAGGAKF
ncbi:MAG: hypothetical protein ACLSE6_07155 [Alphaproteobacteria bacterium]